MNPFNFIFNAFQNPQGHPFNPFGPDIAETINNTVRNALNSTLNPLGGLFANPPQPNMGNIPNVHVNNWNNSSNFFGAIFSQPGLFPFNGGFPFNEPGVPQDLHGNPFGPGAGPNNQEQQRQQERDKQKEKDMKAKEKSSHIAEAEKNPNSGHFYKKIGNEYYVKGLYSQALENYTRAIEENNTESIFYSNRARCYKKLGEFNKAYEDANASIELDDKNVKAHLLCGQILAEIGKREAGFDKLNKAIIRMEKALKLCTTGQDKKDFTKDLEKNILKVKKIIYLKETSIKKEKKAETLKYIKQLIDNDSDLTTPEAKANKYQEAVDIIGNPLENKVSSVPDNLCCKITMDLLEDPVITKSGMTYEKDALNEHLNQRGKFDPVTREEINPEEVYPNLTIKKAIKEFLDKNPGAFESKEDEKYLDVEL